LPLLVVRSNNQQEETNRRLHYRNILLPFDSSRRAESALSAAIVLVHAAEEASFGADRPLSVSPEADAVLPESKLFLAAVVTPPEIPLPRPYPEEISKLTDQLLQVSRDAVQAYLRVMKLRLPVESEINVVESSNVSSAIEELANQVNADLVLMSAHGYSGQFTYPYGSVTRRYMEQGSKPVLVIQDLPRSQVQSTSRGASRIVEPRASGVRQASTYS
jgi:nucleotide-binding universal stress UspA family protein